MPALRPIIHEPRSTVEREAGAVLAVTEALTPTAPHAHPGLLMTTESAGTKLKGGLGGGFFNPASNKAFR